jgi:glycosyltransferase involved in cell wall biosynthesis
MNESPLVTCLCLTMAGRKEFLKRAVECFRSQTYERRELIIAADSLDDLPRGWEFWVDIQVIIYHEKMNVGKKRNLTCESATGHLIAIWDDDDFSSRDRLAWQVKMHQKTGKAVNGFGSMKFTDGSDWWKFTYQPGLVFGTSLLFARDWWRKHPFPEMQIGEDVVFADTAARENQLLEMDARDLMYATIHPGNTSAKRLDQAGWVKLEGFEWGKK